MKPSNYSDKKANNILLGLLAGTLAMVGVAAILSIVLIEMVRHPEWRTPEPQVVEISAPAPDPNRIENGIDVETGFIAEGNYLMVKQNCTGCHSAKLVTQNRSSREGWEEMIRWMQREQKLWDLGPNEGAILDYLAKYYGPQDKGRRQNLEIEEWYEISSTSIIEAKDLQKYLHTKNNLAVIEVSKFEAYQSGHIPNALPCSRSDFTSTDYPYGGMRGTSSLIETLMKRLGVNTGDSIVVYDKKGNADALRLWWLLNLYGYSKVAVLNGGQPAWEQEGFNLSHVPPTVTQGNFQFPSNTIPEEYLATKNEVETALLDSTTTLLDTRSKEEFTGEKQKKGALHPGRIPGSINLDWAYAIRYGEDFRFKSREELKNLFEGIGVTPENKIIVYCHSGVRSSHTTFVLREILGYPDVTNYDGSWTEWSHLASNEMISTSLNN